MRSGLFLATMLAASSLAAAEMPLTIDQLLAQGWEIAGCASGYDNRTSLILFRHPGVNETGTVRPEGNQNVSLDLLRNCPVVHRDAVNKLSTELNVITIGTVARTALFESHTWQ